MIVLNIALVFICGYIAYSVRDNPDLKFSFYINLSAAIINALAVALHFIALPEEIKEFWSNISHYDKPDSAEERVILIRRLIAEYQTEDCEITAKYRTNNNE